MSDVDRHVTGESESSILVVQKAVSRHTFQNERMLQSRPLSELRYLALISRAEASEMRRRLRDLRIRTSLADEKFMKVVRERRSQNCQPQMDSLLNDAFQELQAARDAYGPLEEQYNEAEQLLDRTDYKISKLEQAIANSESARSGKQSDVGYEVGALSGFSGEEEWVTPNRSPGASTNLRDAYLSRLGDADIFHEELSWIRLEHEQLLEMRDTKSRVGLELMAEDQAILANFATKEANIVDKLLQIEEDIERLRMEWNQQGHLIEVKVDESDTNLRVEELSEGAPSEYQRFPLLLQKPEDDEYELRKLLVEFDGTGNRISRWLMHKLRSSCSEVELLFRLSLEECNISDNEEWQQDVISYWYKDSTNLPPLIFESLPTLEATTILTNAIPIDERISQDTEKTRLKSTRDSWLMLQLLPEIRGRGDSPGKGKSMKTV